MKNTMSTTNKTKCKKKRKNRKRSKEKPEKTAANWAQKHNKSQENTNKNKSAGSKWVHEFAWITMLHTLDESEMANTRVEREWKGRKLECEQISISSRNTWSRQRQQQLHQSNYRNNKREITTTTIIKRQTTTTMGGKNGDENTLSAQRHSSSSISFALYTS